jgi:hypothetical protein
MISFLYLGTAIFIFLKPKNAFGHMPAYTIRAIAFLG